MRKVSVEPEFDVVGGGVRQKSGALQQRHDRTFGGLRQSQFAIRARPLVTRGVNDLKKGKIDFGEIRKIKIGILIVLKQSKKFLRK